MKPTKKNVSRTSKTRVYVSRCGKAQESERAESSRRRALSRGAYITNSKLAAHLWLRPSSQEPWMMLTFTVVDTGP